MACLRVALFAVLAAVATGNLLQKGNPTKTAKATEAKDEVSLQAVQGGVVDGRGPENSEYELIGEVDEERQWAEAEKGRPIDEDKMPHVEVKAVEPVVEEEKPEPLREGMEKVDGEALEGKTSGVFNPMTGQVESSLIQVSRKDSDLDVEDTEDLDEDDAAIVDDEAETMDEAEDTQTTEDQDEENDADSEDSSEEEQDSSDVEEVSDEDTEQDFADEEEGDAIKEEAEDMENEDEAEEENVMDDVADDTQEEAESDDAQDTEEQDAEPSDE